MQDRRSLHSPIYIKAMTAQSCKMFVLQQLSLNSSPTIMNSQEDRVGLEFHNSRSYKIGREHRIPFSATRSTELTSRSQVIVSPQYNSQAKVQYPISYQNNEISLHLTYPITFKKPTQSHDTPTPSTPPPSNPTTQQPASDPVSISTPNSL